METEVVKTAIQVDFNTIITAVSALIVVGVNINAVAYKDSEDRTECEESAQ